MGFWVIFTVAFGLSLDIYAVTICQGSMLERITKGAYFRTSVIFFLWQSGAVCLGGLLSMLPYVTQVSQDILFAWRLLSALIFATLAAALLYRGIRHKPIQERRQELTGKLIHSAAAITSIDALLTGAAISAWSFRYVHLLLCTGISTLAAVGLGLYTGYRLGYEPKRTALLGGGTILAAIAVYILLRTVR